MNNGFEIIYKNGEHAFIKCNNYRITSINHKEFIEFVERNGWFETKIALVEAEDVKQIVRQTYEQGL